MPTSGTPDLHHTHVAAEGDTLDGLAQRYYEDATRWREIAQANGMDDPLRIKPGDSLVIPAVEPAPSGFRNWVAQLCRRYTSSR